jgi:hypothetical protein
MQRSVEGERQSDRCLVSSGGFLSRPRHSPLSCRTCSDCNSFEEKEVQITGGLYATLRCAGKITTVRTNKDPEFVLLCER